MPHRFSRKELYDLVWSEPMKTLAACYKISDSGLSKACRRYAIPVPERGYWAKLRAGKRVHQRPLPPRGPGMCDELLVGARNNWAHHYVHSNEEILALTPSPPVFERDIENVITEVRKGVGRVTVPKTMPRPHRLIAQLLEADEERREKVARERFVFSWDHPKFDSPFERRRLRFLNAIFTALERYGAKPWVRGKEARDLGMRVNDQNVTFGVDDTNARIFQDRSYYYEPCRKPSGRMRVAIASWRSSNRIRQSWEDTKGTPVETAVADIVVELIVSAERQYREGAEHWYEYQVRRKAELIEEARCRKEEGERKERERLARLEQQRIERLLADAAALRQARDIRAYVREVKSLCAAASQATSDDEVRAWELWALAQADRIDPVASGKFRESLTDPAEP